MFLRPIPNPSISQAHRALAVAVLMAVLLSVMLSSAIFSIPGGDTVRRGLSGFGVWVRGREGRPEADFLVLKHACSILGQTSNFVQGGAGGPSPGLGGH